MSVKVEATTVEPSSKKRRAALIEDDEGNIRLPSRESIEKTLDEYQIRRTPIFERQLWDQIDNWLDVKLKVSTKGKSVFLCSLPLTATMLEAGQRVEAKINRDKESGWKAWMEHNNSFLVVELPNPDKRQKVANDEKPLETGAEEAEEKDLAVQQLECHEEMPQLGDNIFEEAAQQQESA